MLADPEVNAFEDHFFINTKVADFKKLCKLDLYQKIVTRKHSLVQFI